MARVFRISSSTQVAAIFSSLIGIAAVFAIYQMFLLQEGDLSSTFFVKVTLALLLLICIGLFIVGHYVTQRINLISATAEKIMRTTDLSQRIPTDPRSDDLAMLSSVLNGMLEEIEHLVNGIRTVTDNIAHDLRHPLTRLRNHLEQVKESNTQDPETLQAHLSALIGECDTLLSTFNALLRISNIESGKLHSEFEHVNLKTLLSDIIELYEPIAQEKSITIEFTGDQSSIVGDKHLLFQAFTNIIDNAIKYTRKGGTVRMRLGHVERNVKVEIEDEGPGIPAVYRNHVFQRFFRLDDSRNTPGSGLGLSLVKAVVDMHKGVITLDEGRLHGLLIRVTF